MKLEKWALIAEIAGGVAVVVTLVFLIIGIRENTEVTRASMYANTVWELNETQRAVMSDPELSRIMATTMRGDAPTPPEDDASRLVHAIAIFSRVYDTAYTMNSYGLLGPNEWRRFDSAICNTNGWALDAGVDVAFLATVSEDFRTYADSKC